jgi:hypothetical protein
VDIFSEGINEIQIHVHTPTIRVFNVECRKGQAYVTVRLPKWRHGEYLHFVTTALPNYKKNVSNKVK